jgi:hypothetical protein
MKKALMFSRNFEVVRARRSTGFEAVTVSFARPAKMPSTISAAGLNPVLNLGPSIDTVSLPTCVPDGLRRTLGRLRPPRVSYHSQ